MKKLLLASAITLGLIGAVAAEPLANYQAGPRLINGTQLNKMVAVVNNLSGNGTAQAITGTTGTFSGALTSAAHAITSSSANALVAGRQGATAPAFKVDASASLSATGMEIVSAAAASGVNLRAISSGTNENLTINAKGSGTITIAPTSTGIVTITPATTITGVLTNTGGYTSVTGAQLYSGTAIPAGGTTAAGLKMSSTANLGLFFGSGVPTLSAAQGSIYIRTDGSSTSTRLYINSNGTTGWVAVTTAS